MKELALSKPIFTGTNRSILHKKEGAHISRVLHEMTAVMDDTNQTG